MFTENDGTTTINKSWKKLKKKNAKNLKKEKFTQFWNF